jgi:hypothetical protein
MARAVFSSAQSPPPTSTATIAQKRAKLRKSAQSCVKLTKNSEKGRKTMQK